MPGASKYEPLTRHLQARGADTVPMKFSELERVIGARLPPSALRNRAYWSNNAANSVMTRAWLAAGFRSEQVDLTGRKLVFRRIAAAFGPEERRDKLALFGCMKGTVVWHGDLTEPTAPDWAPSLDEV